jgi:hypothetical protein
MDHCSRRLDQGSALPPTVRRILKRARQRWHALPAIHRPGLEVPISALGIFQPQDLVALTFAGWWPLPAGAVAFIRRPPASSAHVVDTEGYAA